MLSAVKYPQGIDEGGITFRKQVDSSGGVTKTCRQQWGCHVFMFPWSHADRAGPIMLKSLMIMPCCTAHKIC